MALVITGGILKGRRIASPSEKAPIRPTSSKLREALFSMLTGQIDGSTFIDCYAGTGAVGLEAWSRGAAEVHFIERDRKTLDSIRKQASDLQKSEPNTLGRLMFHCQSTDTFSWQLADTKSATGTALNNKSVIVFSDPPFSNDFSSLESIIGNFNAKDVLRIIQFPSKLKPEWLNQASKIKEYGESSLAFLN